MLTPKQQRFVEEYLLDLCAAQAAVRAGYSEKYANRQGSQLLDNPEIKAAIEKAKSERSEDTGIAAERVLREIAVMAFYDPADLVGASRRLTAGEEPSEGEAIVCVSDQRFAVTAITSPACIAGLPEDVRRAIVGWSWDRNGNFTLKLADKSKALDQLARHLSLYNDRVEVSGADGWAERLSRARARLDAMEEADGNRTFVPEALSSPDPELLPPPPVRSHEPRYHAPSNLTGSDDWYPPAPPEPSLADRLARAAERVAPAAYRPILPLKPTKQ